MSFFKRIFGKGNPESDKHVQSDFEKVESGEVNKIYPILKPGDWVGLKAGALHQILLGTTEQSELVIAYGYDAPSNFVFITNDNLKGRIATEIYKEAFENIQAFESNFEISEALESKVLTASGLDFSSEKILCKDFMQKAHELLNAKELLVSIARRRCMMITARDVDKEILNKFVYLHNHAWEDDSYGNAPILNSLFVMVDGEINGVIPLGN